MKELYHEPFEAYHDDTKIFELLKAITTKSKHAMITLLVAQYEAENNIK